MTAPGTRSEALENLRQAISALRPHLTTADQQAALFLIEDTADQLAQAQQAPVTGLMQFDASRLAHLLDLTGPNLAPELLARLTEDLVATETALGEGAASADWKRLREGSHVLISLAGSVGALSLQAMAENLNAAAHRQDRDAVAMLMPPLEGELASLIQLIRATKAPNGRL
jgi:HPt (histidine-containing phosphotransfer) domain-containing protein